MASIIGQLIGNLALLTCSYWFQEMSSSLILVSTIGYYLGGLHCFSMLVHSMLTDITDETVRSKRIVLLGGSFRVGILAGQSTGAALKKSFGFVPSMATLISLLGFLYTLIFVNDVKKSDAHKNVKTEDKLKLKALSSFFGWRRLVQSFRCLFLKRSESKRFCLLMTGFCFGLVHFAETGGFVYLYLYLRRVLDIPVDLVDYAMYRNAALMNQLMVQFLVVPIVSEKYGVGDTVLTMVDGVSRILKNVTMALAFKVWIVYLSVYVAILDGVSTYILSSIVTKVSILKQKRICTSFRTKRKQALKECVSILYRSLKFLLKNFLGGVST